MRRFNPERELYKIKYGKRDKIFLSIIFLLVISLIGSTFALYQVRHSKRIIYTTVSDFRNNKDIILAVYYDNQEQNDFPKKGDNYVFDRIDCDNKAEDYTVASWNYNAWGLSVLTKGPNKCDVYFRKLDKYQDTSGANPPELYQGLIPVYYGDNGEVYVANLEQEWYDYDKHNWANAVLIDTTSKTVKDKYFNEDNTINSEAYNEEIPMGEILQMYVWIPRYKYELFNAKNESKPEQMINIEFERETATTGTVTCSIASNGKETCENDDNGKWYTHPAFKFGNTDLTGIWVGKFESSGSKTNLKVIPNANSLVNTNIFDMFNASRYIEEEYANNYNINKNEIDTHMMKSMEWGAMAYLTHSKYGRCVDGTCTEVSRNATQFLTGYANTNESWNTANGMKASTTGNIYGIYDTNGCAWEFLMGVIRNQNGSDIDYGYSGFSNNTLPDSKYYDLYTYEANSSTSYQRGHLGDATREVVKILGSQSGAWYSDQSLLPFTPYSWFSRSGSLRGTTESGTFGFYYWTGAAEFQSTFRMVITHA